jgi:uncharacterized protein YuzE
LPYLATTIDPQDRLVVLTVERWTHILARHPELGPSSEPMKDQGRAPHRLRAKGLSMTVTVGDLTFDNVVDDEDADVLYLHVGDPAAAVEFDESPEGHALGYDAAGRLVGITIVNPRWLLEHDEAVTSPCRGQSESTSGPRPAQRR